MDNVNSDIDDLLIFVSQNSQIETMETENDNLNLNSNLDDLDLNALFRENQAQDENRSDTETQMDENILLSVKNLYEEYAQLPDVDQMATLSEERSSYDLNSDDSEQNEIMTEQDSDQKHTDRNDELHNACDCPEDINQTLSDMVDNSSAIEELKRQIQEKNEENQRLTIEVDELKTFISFMQRTDAQSIKTREQEIETALLTKETSLVENDQEKSELQHLKVLLKIKEYREEENKQDISDLQNSFKQERIRLEAQRQNIELCLNHKIESLETQNSELSATASKLKEDYKRDIALVREESKLNRCVFVAHIEALTKENASYKSILHKREAEHFNIMTRISQMIAVSEKAQIQKMETENDNLRSKILDLEDVKMQLREELESVNVLRSAKESHLEAQIKELEELVANLKTSSEQEKTQLEAQIQEIETENLKQKSLIEGKDELLCHFRYRLREQLETITNLKESSLQEKIQLEAQIQEKEKENHKQKSKIEELEELLTDFECMDWENLKTISNLEESLQKKETENHRQKSIIKELEEVLANLHISSLQEKTRLGVQIQDAEMESDKQISKIKELEELLTNLQSREQEHLKTISDLETNSHKQKTRFEAQIQEMVNARVPLESSVDDVIDEKVDEKELIPSKSQDDGKNTGEIWKKGLLIGGGCVAAAVALWKYGPDVAGIASALNRPRLIGNLF